MRHDFFNALSSLAEAAADPLTADLVLATLAYCTAELEALAAEAASRPLAFWRVGEDAWLLMSRDEVAEAQQRYMVWLEFRGGRRRIVLDTQDRQAAEAVAGAIRQVGEMAVGG